MTTLRSKQVTVWYVTCSLCGTELTGPLGRGYESEQAALSHLNLHRRDRHVADFVPDPPFCEGCGKTGSIEAQRSVRTADHVDIKYERNEYNQIVQVDRSNWVTRTETVTERLKLDDDTPWPLPERWWHASCHTAYLADVQMKKEIDDRYEQRIAAEKAAAEAFEAIKAKTEAEGAVW